MKRKPNGNSGNNKGLFFKNVLINFMTTIFQKFQGNPRKPRKFGKIIRYPRKSQEILENPRKSLKILENPRKF